MKDGTLPILTSPSSSTVVHSLYMVHGIWTVYIDTWIGDTTIYDKRIMKKIKSVLG